MAILNEDVNTVLREQDIEGLIATGAPRDEYSHEADDISASISSLDRSDLTEAEIVSIISKVWTKYFNLSADDINNRSPAFRSVASKLLSSNAG